MVKTMDTLSSSDVVSSVAETTTTMLAAGTTTTAVTEQLRELNGPKTTVNNNGGELYAEDEEEEEVEVVTPPTPPLSSAKENCGGRTNGVDVAVVEDDATVLADGTNGGDDKAIAESDKRESVTIVKSSQPGGDPVTRTNGTTVEAAMTAGSPAATTTMVTLTPANNNNNNNTKVTSTLTTNAVNSASSSNTPTLSLSSADTTNIKYFLNGNNGWTNAETVLAPPGGTANVGPPPPLMVGNFNSHQFVPPHHHHHHHHHVPPPPPPPHLHHPHIFSATLPNGGGSNGSVPAVGSNGGFVVGGNQHRGHSPNRPNNNRYTPSPHSRGTSPNQGPTASSGTTGGPTAATTPLSGPPPPLTAVPPPQQHVVDLHVNLGEAISFRMGDQLQLIQGPATVRMVSNNPTPPIPIPVQVPPGHMLQQIVDQHGTLRSVILSPQPPMTVGPMDYTQGPGPTTGPASPHYYPYPPPYAHHPHPQYHHPHPANAGPPPPHMQPPPGHQMHGQVSPLPHQCNSHHPAHQGPSPPPPPLQHHHLPKDERTQRQILKMKRILDARKQRDSSNVPHNTPPTSPKKENNIRKYKDRNTSTSGLEENNEENAQDEEDTRILTELLSKVSPPKVSDVTPRSALLRWKPPEMLSENGENKYSDFEIAESDFVYEVLLAADRKDGKYKVAYSGAAAEHALTDLKPATEYHVCLQANLDELRGIATESVMFKTESCEPDCPQPPKVSNRTKTSLTLRWNAAVDNGSRITTYVLEYDEGRGNGHFVEVSKGQQKQFKLVKLAAATYYRFRLYAVNEIGRSKFSDVVCYSTTGSPPGQPNPPLLKEAHVARLHLVWQKRPNDDDFTLQMEHESSGHGFLPVFNGRDTQYVCTHLQRNTEYKFRLCANNEEGSSRWSEVVSFRTRPDRPSVPSKPAAKGHVQSRSFKVSWDPPRDTGGSEILKYSLEMDSGNGFEEIYSGLETELMCNNLQPGTTHRVRALCVTAGGASEYSDVNSLVTLPVCPGQCAAPRLHGKPKATTLHLKWAYPEYDGGSAITEYEIDMTSPDNTTRQAYRGRDTDCMVAGLLPGRPYLFQVRAVNKAGIGPWSDPLEVVSGAGPPDRPKEPRVVCKSPHQAQITWEEPVNNGATVTEFRLEWSIKEADFALLFQGAGFSYEVKGLTPATQHNFRLQAINSAGISPFSCVSLCVTPPSSPGNVSTSSIKHSATATSIQLTWKEPTSHGSDIVSYNIDLGERHSIIAVGNEPECCVQDLQPETTYRIRIQAVNSVGVGPFSSTVKVSTLSLPPVPPKLECVGISHNSLKLKWGEGKNSDFTQYTLELENKVGSFVPVYQGPCLSHKIAKLQETTDYRFRIFAKNDAGDGPYSDVCTFVTCKAPPPPLKAPRVFDVTESSCSVEWQAAKPVGEDAIIYQLQLLNARDQEFRLVYRGSDLNHRIAGLEPKTEYSARVGTIRQCGDGQGDLVGAFSPSTSFSTPCREPVRTAHSRPASSSSAERKPLTDQQWAVILLCTFTLLSVLVAVVLQQLIALSKRMPSS